MDEILFPVIYDLDEDGHATGTVHFFCSVGCRTQSPHNERGGNNRGVNPAWCVSPNTICETCHKELEGDV